MNFLDHESLVEKGKDIILNAEVLYIDVDVEADGIAGFGSMLSLGAVAATGEEFYAELKPIPGPYIPENRKFCEEHGIHISELLKTGQRPNEAMINFHTWLINLKNKYHKKLVMVGYNAGFDKSFIDLYFNMFNIINPFDVSPLDLKSLLVPLVNDWNFKLTSKKLLPDILKIDREFTHSPLDDAKYQQELHFATAGYYSFHKL